MQRRMKKLLCVVLATVMCLSVFGSAMASTMGTGVTPESAGKYGTVGGSLSYKSGNVYGSTSVTTNPDGATLYLKVDINSQTMNLTHDEFHVDGGTCLPLQTIPVVDMADAQAVRAFSTHEVRGNQGSYSAYGYASIG